jgi:nucleoside-triphosphatase
MDGKEGVLAHQHIRSPYKVGKYGVNLDHIDRIAVPSMIPSKSEEIIVIDEIGKMECFSPLFRQTLMKILDSENPIIASIAQKGDRFIQEIKQREDILLLQISEKNRDEMVNLPQFYERFDT